MLYIILTRILNKIILIVTYVITVTEEIKLYFRMSTTCNVTNCIYRLIKHNPINSSFPSHQPPKSNKKHLPNQGKGESKPCERKTRKEDLRIPTNDKHQRRQDELGKRRKLGEKGRGLARRQEAPRQNKVKREKKDLFLLEEERQIERAQKKKEEEKEKGEREEKERSKGKRERRKVKRAEEELNSPLPSLVCNFRGLTYSSISRRPLRLETSF